MLPFLSFNSSLYVVAIELMIDSTTQSYVNITRKIIIVPISAQKAKIISQRIVKVSFMKFT